MWNGIVVSTCSPYLNVLNEALLVEVPSELKIFSYIIEGGVCYLILCEWSYPKKLAYQYLEELQREFEKVNRSQIETIVRPYAFIKFGSFLKTLAA